MMEEDFYATIKLKSGEEIFAKIMPIDENDKTLILITNPIVVTEIKSRSGTYGYKIEPWLKTTTEDMFIIDVKDVLTMSESNDIEMMTMHQQFIRKTERNKSNKPNISRKMGYLANVNDAKEILEKLYKNS